MIPESLGKLERVDLREVWRNEADDFTPWLATQRNLEDLGKTLGMQIEFQAREEAVGPYAADILCRDIDDDSYVVIENQLEENEPRPPRKASYVCGAFQGLNGGLGRESLYRSAQSSD